ncbi:unnamed protein product [Prorocentrum cordatum]|uniref:Uncharacterized protein n=1 Tax=Prorocentrum cordatum TaxID=2364126 RepID=A0ABN9U3S1_9DINO|nr:unnamed protein product [Polarella glacialis]
MASRLPEFRELSDLGLAAEGLVDLWAVVYLAGATVSRSTQLCFSTRASVPGGLGQAGQTLAEAAADQAQQAEGGSPVEGEPQARPPTPQLVPCEAPELVRLLHSEIGGAAAGSDLADSTVCTIRDSQVLSLVPEGVAPGEHVQRAILGRLDREVSARRKFSDWLQGAQRVVIPSASADEGGSERRVYERLMGSVDPSQHTIPLALPSVKPMARRSGLRRAAHRALGRAGCPALRQALHCLAEQVASTLQGGSKGKEDELVLTGIKDYLGGAFDDILTDGDVPAPRHRSPLEELASQHADPSAEGKPEIVIGKIGEGGADEPDDGGGGPRRGSLSVTMAAGAAETVTLHRLDFEACGHCLAGSGGGQSRLWSGDKVVEVTRAVLSHASVPGTRRSGLPASAVYSAAQQTGLQSRVYPFAPSVATEEFEQMWLLHAFEGLLSKAYPEKKWCLADRSYRECIPRELLAQTLQAALASEPLVATAYIPRHDCLIIALYQRSLHGSPLWHSWKCDLGSEHDSNRWADGLFTVPTYNDWLQLFGGSAEGAPRPRFLLDGFDARQVGYGEVVEKLATPADGSVILVSRIGYGKTGTLPQPSNDAGGAGALGQLVEPPCAPDSEDAEPAAATPPPPEQGAAEAPPAFDTPVRYESRIVRVTKDGLTFGFVADRAWAARLQAEQLRREEARAAALEEEEAAAAARAAEGGEPVDAAAPAAGGAEDLPTGMPFEGSQLGTFWMAMAGGARCTARAHHEALPQADLAAAPDGAQPPPMGVVLAYTLANGQVVQVFSDASVQLRWPLALQSGKDGVRATEEAAASGARVMAEELGMLAPPSPPPPVPPASRARVVPGCPEDVEVSRTITPLGTLTRRLLSGRLEVYHTDGSSAVRNPTGAELDAIVAGLRGEPGSGGSGSLDFLERLSRAYGERHQEPLVAPPDAKAVREGLPGHWVVVRPDGSIFGRVARPPPPPPEPPPPPPKPPTPEPEPADVKKAASKKGGKAAAKEEPPPEPEPAPPPPPPPPPPQLHELVGGYFVDDGDIIEYVIEPVAVARQVDIMTKHKTMTNSKGLTMYEDPDDTQKIIVHADGTQVIKTLVEDGAIIEVSKSPMAHVKCELRDSIEIRVSVATSDGTYLVAVPQMLQGDGELVPVVASRDTQPWRANYASVVLTNWEGASVVSTGSGEIKVYTKPQGSEAEVEQAYAAHCTEGLLSLVDKRGVAFEIYGDQTLRVSQEMGQDVSSPRCTVPCKAHGLLPDDAGGEPPPEASEAGGPPPRTFVVHGNGDAEELLCRSDVEELLAAARADPSASVVREPPTHAGSLLEHITVYRSRVPDAPVFSSADLVALPDTLQGNSSELLGTSADALKSPALQPPGISEYSKFIAYPPLSEQDRVRFQGTLGQYRQWEAEQLAKSRAVMKPPEKPKKQKEKTEVKKKKKKGEPPTPPPEPVVVEPEPAFVQDFTIDAFNHHLQVLRRRAEDRARRTAAPTPAAATTEAEEGRVPEEVADGAVAAPDGADAVEMVEAPEQAAAQNPPDGQQLEEGEELEEEMAERQSGIEKKYITRKELDEQLRSLSYWDSDPGRQFLRDSAPDIPESPHRSDRARVRHSKAPPPKRSPWNPRLVGEPEPEDQPEAQEAEPELTAMVPEPQMFSSAPPPIDGSTMPGGGLGATFAPAARAPAPILPERDLQHEGAHPDKKGVEWDVYGELRPQRPPVSQAHITINSDYVAVEGETDRRVRTCSVAHKKNATKAPSVSTVRKSGAHTLGLGSQVGPREILGDPALASAEEQWKLTSTMQGLGDPTKLAEVTPGSLRFGPLRLGSLYRMSFYLRNLDVDVTRFHVKKVQSDLVLREHQSGHLAPGLAERIVVDVAAKVPCNKVEQMIEIKVKAHVIKVLVTARIFDAEEYDRLDAESLALHGRRIGRHREVGDDVNRKSPVQLVDDEKECRQKLGEAYLPPPLDFREDAATSPTFGLSSA